MNVDLSLEACYVPLVPIDCTEGDQQAQRGIEKRSTGFQPIFTPCLLCGAVGYDEESGRQLTLDEIVVKREVPTSNSLEETDDILFPATTSNQVEPITNDSVDDNNQNVRQQNVTLSGAVRWTEDENTIYQWFLKWFKIRLTNEAKNRRVTNLGWDGDTGKDPFPFCSVCKDKLMELVEFQRMVEQLQERIKNGVEALKQKANVCEEAFGRNMIYDKDQRYRRVRKHLVPDFMTRYPSHVGRPRDVPPKELSKSRRSSQRRKIASASQIDYEPTTVTDEDKIPNIVSVLKSKVIPDQELDELIVEAEKASGEEGAIPKIDYTSDHNPVDSDSPEFPVTRRQKSARKRKTASSNRNGFAFFDDPDGDFLDGDEDEDNLPPEVLPVQPSSSKRSKRLTKKKQDEEWEPSKEKNDKDDTEAAIEEDDGMDNAKLNSEFRTKAIFDREKRTVTYRKLLFNQQEPYSDNKYECSKCGAVLSVKSNNISNVRSHYYRNHSDLFACKKCNYRAANNSHLKQHVNTVHEGMPHVKKRPVECPVCLRPTIKAHLRGHLWSHKSQQEKNEAIAREDDSVPQQYRGSFQCDECGKAFTQVSVLSEHKKYAHMNEEWQKNKRELCPICGGTYLHLKSHQKQKHGVGAKEFKCLEPGCGKIFQVLSRLAKHKDVVHKKIREYKCSLCPRTFARPRGLNNHLNAHNGIRPWQCKLCPSAFIYKSNWERHVQSFHEEGSSPRRKSFVRGPAMLPTDTRKKDLIKEGKYLPPSALATWAAGREPTSHFPLGADASEENSK